MSWTEERRARVIELWSRGLSASEIAKDLGGISRNSVIGVVHRMGAAKRHSPSGPNRLMWDEAKTGDLKRLAGSMTPRELCEHFGVSINAIYNKLAKLGVAALSAIPTASPIRVAPRPIPTVVYSGGGITVAEMPRFGRCRWPISEVADADMRMCGNGCGEETYCEEHAKRAFSPTTNAHKERVKRGAMWAAKQGSR